MGRAVVVKRWALTKMTSTTRARKAMRRLDMGPARDTQISPFRQLRKFPGLIMTGLAQPNCATRSIINPTGSIWATGFNVSRPVIRGVSSPIQSATWA